jgi:hypothetical protein
VELVISRYYSSIYLVALLDMLHLLYHTEKLLASCERDFNIQVI